MKPFYIGMSYYEIMKILQPHFVIPDEKYIIDIIDPDKIHLGECFIKSWEYGKHAVNKGIACFLAKGEWKFIENENLYEHFWIEIPNDIVFCGVFQRFFYKDYYYKRFCIKLESLTDLYTI